MSQDALDALSPLAADMRSHSPDCYLATLFAPPEYRDGLFSLYAFDHEIARVQRVVNEPMAGLVRLQWWHDVLEGLERGETVAHPVVQGLQRTLESRRLNLPLLQRAIDARRKVFEDGVSESSSDLETYLAGAGGCIMRAAASLLGAKEPGTQALAERVGLVRATWEALSFNAALFDDPADSIRRSDLIDWALETLHEARGHRPAIERNSLPAFFPGTLAGIRLGKLKSAQSSDMIAFAPVRLFWCWLRGRY